MPQVWRKVLYSGSDAHVRSITASNLANVEDKSQPVYYQSTTGKFLSTGSLYFTESNGGQLYFENLGLTTQNLFISGAKQTLSNNAQIVFLNTDTTGLERTSSLFYDANTNELRFIGTFSGSYVGDGSGLTGVVGSLPNSLISSFGISDNDGNSFSYNGDEGVEVKVKLATNSGIDIPGGSGGLRLTESLAGEGLAWANGAADRSVMKIQLSGSSNGTSGLKLDSNGLALSDNIAGTGITNTSNVLSITNVVNGGLNVSVAGVRLASTLPGTGLSWENTYDIMRVDYTTVVTASSEITFRTGSNNLTLTATAGGDGITNVANGFKARLIDEPEFTYDVNDTLTGDFTLDGNFTLDGSLFLLGSASFSTSNVNFRDQFLLLNSGSNTGDGGFRVKTGASQAAVLFYDDDANRWGVTANNGSIGAVNYNIKAASAGAINTTRLTNDNHATIVASTPIFGTDDTERGGQLVVTTAPSTNESPVYIYA